MVGSAISANIENVTAPKQIRDRWVMAFPYLSIVAARRGVG
jgi:hypothetical protein